VGEKVKGRKRVTNRKRREIEIEKVRGRERIEKRMKERKKKRKKKERKYERKKV
jgi:hypothetical protein